MLDRERVHEVFAEAVALAADQRAAFLDSACAGDPALRAEIESLLAAVDGSPAFMETPTAAGPSNAERVGARIGPYRLLQEIGQGGFGTVYMAEQHEPVRRTVALKIIKAGMDTRAVIARFEAERQALALMDHANIARVLDAGATGSGRPFFVMELVKGDPITLYCDRNSLSIPDRLDLFIQVCHAVGHAHSKGVIHRDIKPTNILVATQDGRPHAKVIDFGIAKATQHRLTEKTLFTEFRQLVGTPEYMSPEQAEGSLDIDTRTDVYALGVLLYELLTGSTPFDGKALRSAAYAEMQRIIREVEPPKPSTRLSQSGTLDDVAAHRRTQPAILSAALRGDLDWIAMKALDKDRGRRYDTPSALAADIARFATGEPVAAVPPSPAYRLRKFVRRNRTLVAAGAVVGGVLVLGIIGTSTGLVVANSARADEEKQRRAAQANALRAVEEARRADEAAADSDRRREAAEYESYIANIESASGALILNNATRLRTRLDACPPERRNWEWRYLDAASDSSLLAMRHPGRNVQFAAFSPDARQIATTSGDGKVRLWDPATGAELAALEAPERFWGRVDFSADGRWILAPARDGRVWLWDARTLRETAVVKGHSAKVTRAFFIGDGSRFVTASEDGSARVWEAPDGRQTAAFLAHQGPISDLSATPDGARIATASHDGTVRVWSSSAAEELAVLRGHSAEVEAVRWSPDAGRLATASADGTARVWDGATGREISHFNHGSMVYTVAFHPDGSCLVSAGADGTPRVWNAATGAEMATLRGHTNTVWGVGFSHDGTTILTNSADNTVRLWDASTGRELACLRAHFETPWVAMFSPDGTRIVTGGDVTLRFWAADHAGAGWSLSAPLPDSESVGWSPDESAILEYGPGRARRIDFASAKVQSLFERIDFGLAPPVFSPDGACVLGAFLDHTVDAWDMATGRTTLTLRGHESEVSSIAFRSDGARIVTASQDGTARVWDAATGAELLTLRGHEKSVNRAAYDPAGTRIVTASDDGRVRIWDAETGAALLVLRGHDNAVRQACFSPDGRRILSTSSEYTARVWDGATGGRLLVLRGHEHVVYGGEFSPDGSRIVTCSFDGTARIWDASSGRELLSIKAASGAMHSAHFSADGTRLLLGSSDGRAWVLDSVPFRDRFAKGQAGPQSEKPSR